uniref:Expressed conserved protein n=1 Tax=Echinococcus granulosus TaxID=6210 RepID=A0A068WQ22_ECHGR|nr:hypothetical protein EgrG_000079400 [Echinococcus granulosus]
MVNLTTKKKVRSPGTLFANVRYKFGIYFSLINYILIVVSFVSPYWLQRWPRIHTPFRRLGLWEFCLDGYIARLDSKMVSHFECWWIFSPYLSKIFTNLVPWWFLLIQIFFSVALFTQAVLHFVFIFYWCYPIENIERRLRFLQFAAVCHGITFIIFGVEHKNPNWMPYPTLNWASWSYGLAVLSTFLSLFVMLAFAFTWRESKRTLETAGYEFPMSAVMKKREKQAILEQQKRQVTASGLEKLETSVDQTSEHMQSFTNE